MTLSRVDSLFVSCPALLQPPTPPLPPRLNLRPGPPIRNVFRFGIEAMRNFVMLEIDARVAEWLE